jgi:hypothetical protein
MKLWTGCPRLKLKVGCQGWLLKRTDRTIVTVLHYGFVHISGKIGTDLTTNSIRNQSLASLLVFKRQTSLNKPWFDDDVARDSRDQRSGSVPSPRNRRCACHQVVVHAWLRPISRLPGLQSGCRCLRASTLALVHLGMPPDQPDCPTSSAPLRVSQKSSRSHVPCGLLCPISGSSSAAQLRDRVLSACLALFCTLSYL